MISRLARRGGVKRISGEIYDGIRGALKDHLRQVSVLPVPLRVEERH